MSDLTSYRLEGSAATITMDDGKVNVISRRMLGELNAALDRALPAGFLDEVVPPADAAFA